MSRDLNKAGIQQKSIPEKNHKIMCKGPEAGKYQTYVLGTVRKQYNWSGLKEEERTPRLDNK